MQKKWTYLPSPDPEMVKALSSAININNTLSAILIQRNITDFDQAKNYFRPSLSDLHDPFLMKNMEKAVKRIIQAMEQQEKILIYGDYDVDGTTAVALVYDFLHGIYPNIAYYIPDRYSEGYGISHQGINWASQNNFQLVIALDCGIKAVKQITEAASKGIDFIVCDHHLPGVQLPPALAILDPKQPDCPYPFKELSGAGVGFKLLQAFCHYKNIDLKRLYQYLDLVTVSIASDIVPISGENRILAHWGLKKLNKSPRPGLKALIKTAGLKQVDITGIVFGIGPRINASGRMEHARSSVDLLLSDQEEEILELAANVNHNNSQRKDLDASITQEALKMIAANEALIETKSTVLYKDGWHKGVIGIVASRCIEKYYRPTIIFTQVDQKATGSARSVDGFDIYEAILECADLLEQFGGHKYAAGITLDVKNIKAFQQKFEQVVARRILPEQLVPQIVIDQKVNLDRITHKFYNILRQFAPFGPDNMDPVFVSENLVVKGKPNLINQQHIRFFARQEDSNYALEAIGFDMAEHYEQLQQDMSFNLAYHVCVNSYKGYNFLQLNIKDIQFNHV
ncbi:MAG: single-stranded-DNA-specific exonuclease RecJ [Candidatus Cyclobacteriaceae bacterium M3_2C_046]